LNIKAIKTRIFKENENLLSFIFLYIKDLPENSIVVVTSKIVALAEGRTVMIDPTLSHEKMRERVIQSESQYMLRTKYTWLTIKDGMVMSSAGIDESNADGKIILLPKDSYKSAEYIHQKLKLKYKVKNLGVIVTDSRVFPLRAGVIGAAIGYAGFKGVRDYRGMPDIFGRTLKVSRTDVADALATAAVVLMGEGDEQQPLAVITGAPAEFTEKVNKKELLIDPREDLYKPFFENIKKLKKLKFKSWNK